MVKKLTAKQEYFCQEYLKDMNATQSAIRAGYSEKTAGSVGHEILKKPEIAERLQELMLERSTRTQIDADWVLNRLAEIDAMDVADILRDDLSVKPISEWPSCWRRTLSGVDVSTTIINRDDETAETILKKIKWPDKVRNLELIGKHVNVKAWDREKESSAAESVATSLAKIIESMPS